MSDISCAELAGGILFILAIIFVIGLMIIGLLWIGHKVVGLELTAEQKQDEALTQVCMLYHIDNKECFLVYGGTDYEP